MSFLCSTSRKYPFLLIVHAPAAGFELEQWSYNMNKCLNYTRLFFGVHVACGDGGVMQQMWET